MKHQDDAILICVVPNFMGIHVVEYDYTTLVPDDIVIADLHAAVFPVAWDD
jgi:hypothetical protein